MSFYGKTYRRISAPNAAETFEKLGFAEEAYGLVHSTDASFTFVKNRDGSIRFVGELKSGLILSNKWHPNEDSDFVTATGAVIQTFVTVDENTMKWILRLPNGKKLNVDGYFSDSFLKLEFYIPGVDIVLVMDYEAVNK